MRDLRRFASILLLSGLVAACLPARGRGEGPPSPGSGLDLEAALRGLHFDRYLTGPPYEPDRSQADGWQVFRYRASELRCIEGGEFFLWARRGAQSENTIVWLDGGGACWPGRDDCAKQAEFHHWIEESGLASADVDNPVRTWNFVYVPYCDGSLHLGDREADYDGDGEVDHWHWGLRTTTAAGRLAAELFPESGRILIAGCSAGGAGTIGAAAVLRLLFPDARLYVLNLSGLGLVDPSQPELPVLLGEAWGIDDFVPPDCPRCAQRLAFFYDWLLDRDPGLRVGVYSALEDAVVSAGWGMPPETFRSLLVETTEAIGDEHPGAFRRFLIDGDTHCPGDYGVQLDGTSLWEWIGQLVNDDPRWVDLVAAEAPSSGE